VLSTLYTATAVAAADRQHDQAGFAGVVDAAENDVQLQESVPDASSDVSSESDWCVVSD
jgi:hypothetical protein